MNENANFKKEEESLKDSQDVAGILKKMQVKLDSIEKKLDSLMEESRPKPFKNREFPRARRDFDDSSRPKGRRYEGKKEEVSSEGKFYHGRPFGKKKDSGKSSFKKDKKPFDKFSKK